MTAGPPSHEGRDVSSNSVSAASDAAGGGWLLRREQILHTLTALAGLTEADLTIGDGTVIDGTAIIITATGTVIVEPGGDDGGDVCGPCALARWQHALDVAVTTSPDLCAWPPRRSLAPPGSHTAHRCRATAIIDPATQRLPLLPPVDPWGPLLARSSARSRRAAGLTGAPHAAPGQSSQAGR